MDSATVNCERGSTKVEGDHSTVSEIENGITQHDDSEEVFNTDSAKIVLNKPGEGRCENYVSENSPTTDAHLNFEGGS